MKETITTRQQVTLAIVGIVFLILMGHLTNGWDDAIDPSSCEHTSADYMVCKVQP